METVGSAGHDDGNADLLVDGRRPPDDFGVAAMGADSVDDQTLQKSGVGVVVAKRLIPPQGLVPF